MHVLADPGGEDLCNEFGHRVDETNGSVVVDFLGPLFFGEKDDVGGVEPM